MVNGVYHLRKLSPLLLKVIQKNNWLPLRRAYSSAEAAGVALLLPCSKQMLDNTSSDAEYGGAPHPPPQTGNLVPTVV